MPRWLVSRLISLLLDPLRRRRLSSRHHRASYPHLRRVSVLAQRRSKRRRAVPYLPVGLLIVLSHRQINGDGKSKAMGPNRKPKFLLVRRHIALCHARKQSKATTIPAPRVRRHVPHHHSPDETPRTQKPCVFVESKSLRLCFTALTRRHHPRSRRKSTSRPRPSRVPHRTQVWTLKPAGKP